MGFIRLGTPGDIVGFPGALIEAENPIPLAQCTEAVIESTTGRTFSTPFYLWEAGKFAGFDYTGKVCHIFVNVGGNIGDFDIWDSGNDWIKFIQDPGIGNPTDYNVTDGGDLLRPRTTAELAQIAYDLGYAYTFVSGRYFTDCPEPPHEDACSILWDPLPPV